MSDLHFLRGFFAWCSILNLAVLLLWFLVFRVAHDALYRKHARWFSISVEQFDALN